jgi:metal-responsive CopG/Arc/MetJ family transcriptional regulator
MRNMTKTSKTVTLSLPSDLSDKIDEVIKEEGKNRSEIFRDALKRFIEEREWQKIYRYGEMKAREKEITEDQIEDIIDARRK